MSLIIDPYRFAAASSAPSLRDYATAKYSVDGNYVNLPAGRQTGDLALIVGGNSYPAITGWTQHGTISNGFNAIYVFSRVLDGTESTPLALSGDYRPSSICAVFKNCSGVDAISTGKDNRSTSVAFNSVTSTVANCLILGCVGWYTAPTALQRGPSSDYTELAYYSGDANRNFQIEAKTEPTSGTYTPGSYSTNGNWNVSFAVALKP